MDKQGRWTILLVLGIFSGTGLLVFSLFGNGQICSVQVRYALGDAEAHRDIDKPRPSRQITERQLRERLVPHVCSQEQFEDAFLKEAGNWGY